MKETVNISKRLKRIAAYLPKGVHFVDIGSDHAFLPSYICLNDPTARAIAGEVKPGPFESSQQTISYFGLEEAVEVRYGSGFDVVASGEADTAVIAGMGGILMSSILKSGQEKLSDINCLLLQPNGDADLVRGTLAALQFKITDEDIIKEQGHFYEIILANQSDHPVILNDKACMLGPVLMTQKPPAFCEKWDHEYTKMQRALFQMNKSNKNNDDKIKQFRKKMCWIKEVLDNGKNDTC